MALNGEGAVSRRYQNSWMNKASSHSGLNFAGKRAVDSSDESGGQNYGEEVRQKL